MRWCLLPSCVTDVTGLILMAGQTAQCSRQCRHTTMGLWWVGRGLMPVTAATMYAYQEAYSIVAPGALPSGHEQQLCWCMACAAAVCRTRRGGWYIGW